LPVEFVLKQNYPNPFNATTRIQFTLPQAGPVRLEVFNMLGQRVSTLINKEMPAGYYTFEWNGRDGFGNDVASGMYLYKIMAGDYSGSKKMILLK